MISVCSQYWESLWLRAKVQASLALWQVTSSKAPYNGFSTLICLFWGMPVISTISMQASPFNFCIFVPFLRSLRTQMQVAYNADLHIGERAGNYWISATFKEEEISMYFSGGYSTGQITGKTRYENREDWWQWTLVASPPWLHTKVNLGIYYKYTAFPDQSYTVAEKQIKLYQTS